MMNPESIAELEFPYRPTQEPLPPPGPGLGRPAVSVEREFEPIPTPKEPDNGPTVQILSKMLRILGGGVLVASASTFMLQHWKTGGDITRYLLLLAHTVTLSGAGFFCGLGMRENKGARTFLGVVLAVVPVHFAVLGGLVYSQFGAGAGGLPAYATWVASSPTTALITMGGALAVLAPLCYVSFLTLARPSARGLTLAFLLSNAALLVPIRTPDWVGWVVLAQAAGLLWFETTRLRGRPAMQTLEGRVVRLLLAVPLGLMVGRSLQFYALSDFLVGSLFASLAALVFLVGPMISRRQLLAKVLQGVAALPAGVAWLHLVDALDNRWGLAGYLGLPLFSLFYSATLVGMSLVCVGNGVGYRRAAAVVALAGMGGNLVLHPGWVTSFACLVTGIGIVAYGYLVEQKALLLAGGLGVVFGLGYNLRYALELYSLNQWASLAGLGIVIVVGASALERHHPRLREVAGRVRSQWKAWGY